MANINGSNNKDILNGSSGADKIYGNGGDDTIYGHGGDDTIYGGAGNDVLYGGDGNDIVGGGAGDDIVYGGTGDDTLYGGDGNDILYGGTGSNKIYGGDGNDTVSYADYMGMEDRYGNWVGITLSLNNDIPEYWENTSKDLYYSIENVMGSQYNDIIFGDSNDNVIWGNGGNDYLYGYTYQAHNQSYETQDISLLFAGNDTFYTGSRKDGGWDCTYVYLGLGNNIVYGGGGNDRVEQVTIQNGEAFMAYGQEIGKTILHLGDGNNSYRGAALGGLEYKGGSGEDDVSIEGIRSSGYPLYDASLPINPMIIDLGDGNNDVYANLNSFIFDIAAGHGDDSISLHQESYGINPADYEKIKGDVKINVGDGNNTLHLYGANLSADVTAGKGDDYFAILQHFGDIDVSNYENFSASRKLHAGEGNNRIWLDGYIFSADIITGSGNDSIQIDDYADGVDPVYYEKLFSDVKINAGNGDNNIHIYGSILNTDIIAGNGNDYIELLHSFRSSGTEGFNIFGNFKANAGDGNNVINFNSVGYGSVDIVSGNGDDEVVLGSYGGNEFVTWSDDAYAEKRILHSGGGSDTIDVREIKYFDINSGSENDTIKIYNSMYLNVDAGTGDDKINLQWVSQSYIDMGAGHDEISFSFSNEQMENNTIKGGAGNDTYIITSFYGGMENTIDNYDEDGGFDILKLDASFNKDISDYTAQFEGDDLLIQYASTASVYNQDTSSYDTIDVTSTLRMDNYALGSDYQLNEIHIGEDIYTSDQFLAEMGLTL